MRVLLTMSVMFTTVLVSLGSAGADPATVKWDDVTGIVQAGNQVGSGTGRITGEVSHGRRKAARRRSTSGPAV